MLFEGTKRMHAKSIIKLTIPDGTLDFCLDDLSGLLTSILEEEGSLLTVYFDLCSRLSRW